MNHGHGEYDAMKRIVGMACALTAALAVGAQAQHVLDQGVASELLRGAVANQTVGVLQSSPDFQRGYVTSVIEQDMVQEAARRGLAERIDVQRALMQARYQILIQALREDISRGAPQPADADLQAAFKKDKDRWILPEGYKLDIYAVSGLSTQGVEAVASMVRLQQVDPAKIAAAGGRQLLASEGQQWVGEKDIVPEVWKVLPSLKVGELRQFGIQNNVWLIKRGEYRQKTNMTFEQAREYIRSEIMGQKQQAAWEGFLQARRKALGL